jgi:quaternary ammonium compound-resistance protein SugE
MGTAYAVWGGIGAAGTVLVGILWFGEPVTSVRILLLLALIACIVGLRLTAA